MYMRSFVILVAVSAAAAANIRVRRATSAPAVTSRVISFSTASVVTITSSASSVLPSGTAPLPITSQGPVPVPAPVRIHPAGVNNKCLDVAGNNQANGTPVQVYDCNGSGAQNWIINPGTTQVKLAGTNFCLDAGSTPANGVELKIWQCFDNLAAQTWFYTGDQRIALQNQGMKSTVRVLSESKLNRFRAMRGPSQRQSFPRYPRSNLAVHRQRH
ncbi:hypothetical protein HGRIS_008595 [Hohenbuehelia grisea]|uniref:Ricin B lectin domain-containing protein n=1 Tax=Hohenbuehelia grisea TaxID=104357 RepID=A0ABR3J8G5_9AGAR